MASQPLAFASLIVGGLLITSAISGKSLKAVIAGEVTSLGDPATAAVPTTSTGAAGQVGQTSGAKLTKDGQSFQAFTGSLLSGGGFAPNPGTSQTQGQLPQVTADLNRLGQQLKVTIVGISGYRTPAHSVAVGGFADDPHTRGLAEDIGVNSASRASAASITEAQLASVGLWRPFDPSGDPNNSEVNHVEEIGQS